MAIVRIGSRPALTKEEAREAFARHFAGKYEIVATSAINRDFIVKRNGWSGVGIRLKQERAGTSFIFTGLIPDATLQVFFGPLGAPLLLRSAWKELEAEISAFIENEPSFRCAAPAGMEKMAA